MTNRESCNVVYVKPLFCLPDTTDRHTADRSVCLTVTQAHAGWHLAGTPQRTIKTRSDVIILRKPLSPPSLNLRTQARTYNSLGTWGGHGCSKERTGAQESCGMLALVRCVRVWRWCCGMLDLVLISSGAVAPRARCVMTAAITRHRTSQTAPVRRPGSQPSASAW
jgi:hypothetical protein